MRPPDRADNAAPTPAGPPSAMRTGPRAQAAGLDDRIRNLVELAQRLERLEQGSAPICANYYQALVRHLMWALSEDLPGAVVQTVLLAHPAAAELHESMHYAEWGLARSPLPHAVAARSLATRWLAGLTLSGVLKP